MTRPAIRLALLCVFLAAMGATAYLFWMAERQSQLTETTSRIFDASVRAAEGILFDLRSAQLAYVAAGQGEDFWIARTAALAEDLKSRLVSLKSEASAPASASAFDDALSALQNFEQMDLHARGYVRSHQMLLASDLIFGDALDSTRKMTAAIERGRTAELAARDGIRDGLQRREVFSLGAAAAAATVIVLLLMPSRRPARPSEAAAPAPMPAAPAVPAPADDISLALDSFDALDADEGWTSPQAAAAEKRAETAPPPATPSVDLQAIATVCNDLARVVDTRALPALLERTAEVLDASGIILWIADPDGRELAPIVTHGYPSSLIMRLGTIARDAENATAAAYRTSLLQTVKADAVSNGAIAAPLVTPTGCVGVMAAEVRHEAEGKDAILAGASIVAAQLAALIGPPSTRAKAEAVS